MVIYVGNLPYQATEQQLRDLFTPHGNVSSARVVMDKFTGESKGFGFVEMPDQNEANNAIKALNGTEMMGRSLRVNESQPRPRDGGGPRDRGDRGRRM